MGLLTGVKDAVIDAWSWLNYKPIFSGDLGMPHRRAFPEAAASWVPPEHERRLASYKLLKAYDHNQVGELTSLLEGDSARERREFGDPAMFIDKLTSDVLGSEQTITVPGAEGDQETAEAQAAEKVQTLLREWADEELLPLRMLQTERKAVGLGDGVYLLYWDGEKQRARVKTFDPGFYFPVVGEDDDGSDYPDRIHFAWELAEDKARNLPARVRRITYELDWIRPQTANGVDETGRRPVRAQVMSEATDTAPAAPVLGRGDRVDAGGSITRLYPWSEPGRPSYKTCYLTDATWDLGDLKGPVDVDSLPLSKASFATNAEGEVLDRLDLYQDFVPVIHVPNTVPEPGEHWGQSSLAKALQVFDELSGSDTDSSRASATTGSPMIGIYGKAINGQQQYQAGPGLVWTLGEGGGITTVDTSKNLAELRSQVHDLSERAANVVRIPPVALGTLDPSKMPSGYALELALGPEDSLIAGMRLARDHADRLIPKFVQRLFLAGQHPDWAGITPLPAKIVRGAFRPTDKAAALEEIRNARKDKLISLQTAIRMLQDLGWPIEDAEEEIKRIDARSFDDARNLADALGNPQETADFLGRKAPAEQDPPAPVLPAVPADATLEDPAGQGQQGSGGNTP
ncbi:hypothetical protein AB0454_22995 [Streptomyces sp. NPDC093509]|uniref:hypothetical protein n=1 Tax=Streptomyces sp. NPDC093509 TaxID=3154982 RepID=UPI00344C7F4F